MPSAYHFSLAPALRPYEPEIEHVLQFIEDGYGLVRTQDAGAVLHYGPDAPQGAIAVPAMLFPQAVSIGDDGVRGQLATIGDLLRRETQGLLPSKSANLPAGPIAYDAIGLIFLLLSRLEERDHPARDRYERFPLSAALIKPENGRLYPWADHAARDIVSAVTGNPSPRPRASYSVKFTHDVDRLKGYHQPLDPLRALAGELWRRRASLSDGLARLHTAYFGDEPFWCARRMMDLSERYGLASHFYFMGPSDNRMDSPYVLRMPDTLRRLVAEIGRRGHVTGFHPGFMTATNADEWCRQRAGLEEVVGVRVVEGRQHVLRYDSASTPRIWSDAGMRLDCTLAYPEAVGFRNGTCRPVAAYDLIARRTLPLRQLSTAVMEFGLFGGKYRDLSDEAAAADAAWARDLCREHGGTFTLLFHTSLREPRLWTWFDRVLADATQAA